MARGRLGRARGATLVEAIILIGVVALVALGGARIFGNRVAAAAKRHAACVESLLCDEAQPIAASAPPAAKSVAAGSMAGSDDRSAAATSAATTSVANAYDERALLEDAERIANARPAFDYLPPEGVVPLWAAGPREPKTYGEQGPNAARVEIRAMPYYGAAHVVAEIQQPGAARARVLNMAVSHGRTMNYDEGSCCKEVVGTFYMAPDQLRRFETVYRAHTDGHVYKLGDSNLAMDRALISAGFHDGVGLLSTKHLLGYFGYSNRSLVSRPATEVPRQAQWFTGVTGSK